MLLLLLLLLLFLLPFVGSGGGSSSAAAPVTAAAAAVFVVVAVVVDVVVVIVVIVVVIVVVVVVVVVGMRLWSPRQMRALCGLAARSVWQRVHAPPFVPKRENKSFILIFLLLAWRAALFRPGHRPAGAKEVVGRESQRPV